MKAFAKVLFLIMGILNVLGGFLTGEIINIVLGTAFIVISFVYYRVKK